MTTPVENFNKVENIKQDSPEWVKQKIKSELDNLKAEPFYKIEENNGEKKVDYNMDTVKSYLKSLEGLSVSDVREKGSAWIMSVQIALESQGYDVGQIDGMLGNKTKAAVRSFQEKVKIKVDGDPGPQTIGKLLESLGEAREEQNKQKAEEGDLEAIAEEERKAKEEAEARAKKAEESAKNARAQADSLVVSEEGREKAEEEAKRYKEEAETAREEAKKHEEAEKKAREEMNKQKAEEGDQKEESTSSNGRFSGIDGRWKKQ